MLWVRVPLEATLFFLGHLNANFVQKFQKCQICVIYENPDWLLPIIVSATQKLQLAHRLGMLSIQNCALWALLEVSCETEPFNIFCTLIINHVSINQVQPLARPHLIFHLFWKFRNLIYLYQTLFWTICSCRTVTVFVKTHLSDNLQQ